jgi:membrane-bound lytic murein transglycosylase MltF
VIDAIASPNGRAALFAALIMLAACDQQANPKPSQTDHAAPPAVANPAAPAPTAPGSADPPMPSSVPEAPTDDVVARMLAPWTGDLQGMVERRYIRMLVTFNKTNYFLDGAEQHGATYEAGKAFEAFVNARLKSRHITLQVAFLPVSRDRLFQALVEGRGDIAAANLTITPGRTTVVDFARPFASDVRELAVTAKDQPAIAQVEDLSGREVYVRKSSSYHDSLRALNDRLTAAGRPPVRIVEAAEHLESEDILEMVNAGLIPATVVDDHIAALWQQVLPDIRVHANAVLRSGGRIAWAVRQGAPELRGLVDQFAAANPKGSLAFNAIMQKYFKSTKWIENAASEGELRKFRQAVALFRRYGDKYDFPWLLVASQAYQESQIDQTRRSPAGAVGVMQIKPSTAAGDPINIAGIETNIENNIHAGVKYLRFIVDRYYKDAPMDRLNKGLFSVASYNAGPARISDLRQKASRMGLDPNTWFGNVEVVAAREIGRETVQYVANIYKYYVSYTLVMEQMEARRVREQAK